MGRIDPPWRMGVPCAAMPVDLLVLNYNGRQLLAECLPSVVRAAAASRHDCRVLVIDNGSTDDSIPWLADRYPQVRAAGSPNLGLCSFNGVLAQLDSKVAVLLNNDIKLHEASIDPLVEPLLTPAAGRPCFMTAPLCWQFDGTTYEGMKTAVRWRWGLVQATALYPGHETGIRTPGYTASAGAVLAVDRRKFLELGGFDPLYLPGRLEDLDFAYRGYRAGYQAQYVPEAVAYHRGMASFGPAYGRAACHRLALRNTLLFQWKNLRHPRHVARQVFGLPLRAAWDLCRAPWTASESRYMLLRAMMDAVARLRACRSERLPWEANGATADGRTRKSISEVEFFRQFHPRRLALDALRI
jgi:GT2 family glycosyltransferase